MPINVLIVDDSALIRRVLTEIIDSQPDMRVVGVARDAAVARERIKTLHPDVVTLDIEMPGMNGLDFLEKLMQLRPMPIVMISSLTERNADATLRALELGAVDFVSKPKLDIAAGLQAYSELIADKLRTAAQARVGVAARRWTRSEPATGSVMQASGESVVVVGASTGGTQAVRDILAHMPPDCPAILVTQHMPETFTRAFAERLDGMCPIRVKEAEHGEPVLPGHAYIAPGHSHLLLARTAGKYRVELDKSAPVNRHRPSVDVLFNAAAVAAGRHAIGVILTGMGGDGAAGMVAMKRAGAYNIAQDKATSVVFGMPRMAIEAGAVDQVLPLGEIPGAIIERLGLHAVGA